MGTQTLPEYMEQETIRNMSTGENGYTLPWSIWVDSNRQMWINGNYPVSRTAHGNRSLKIERGHSFVRVYKSTLGDSKFQPSAQCGFVGGSDDMPIEFV